MILIYNVSKYNIYKYYIIEDKNIKDMPLAIIIGFEYKKNTLPGTIIDIYHAYTWCKSFSCNTHIFTDIDHIKDIESINIAINKGIVTKDILTFLKHFQFKSENMIKNKNVINTKEDFISKICSAQGKFDNKLIIYYSGHGLDESIILPSGEHFLFKDFRDMIIQKLDKFVEIFWILDCCNPNGLYLPYKLTNNMFKLSSTKIQCVTNPIILITSSEMNEKSIATGMGSIFTRNLFKYLTNMKNRNMQILVNSLRIEMNKIKTGYMQTVSIYTSYVIDPVLWMWIGQNKNYDIVSDLSLSMIVVRPANVISNMKQLK